uniref:Uncharacterized protein n=1 Tax=Chrysotila carterae TaxID=13221 RepID=A0A7S4BLE5_CHRCT
MLEADKQALRGELAQQVVALQAKELSYLHASFLSLATTSALLVGFGFTGLALFREDDLDTSFAIMQCLNTTLGFDYTRQPAHLSRPPSNSECARHMIGELIDNMWALSCGLGLSNNLVALFISTVTVITGPGMALRGPEGSLGVAIAHMERQHRRALKHFGRGLFAFSCSIVMFGFQALAHLAPLKATTLIAIGIYTIGALHRNGTYIASKFFIAVARAERAEFIPAEELVDGKASDKERAEEKANRKKLGIVWSTPLMRLDKLVVLPYDFLYNKRGGGFRSEEESQRAVRKQISRLIISAQGQVSPSSAPQEPPELSLTTAWRSWPWSGWFKKKESAPPLDVEAAAVSLPPSLPPVFPPQANVESAVNAPPPTPRGAGWLDWLPGRDREARRMRDRLVANQGPVPVMPTPGNSALPTPAHSFRDASCEEETADNGSNQSAEGSGRNTRSARSSSGMRV